MSVAGDAAAEDPWADWLMRGRDGGDPAYQKVVRQKTLRYADRLLDAAGLEPGMTLADVGAGEGLVALRAIERVGPGLRVLLTDVSATLLARAESLAAARGIAAQCRFLRCGAEQLEGVADASVDVVVTRAVLAYVPDKPAALRAFHRVLKPGGRISLAEPIFRDEALVALGMRLQRAGETEASRDPLLDLVHRWQSAQYPDTPEEIARSPLTNFSERDLLTFARVAGFDELHLELHIDEGPSPVPGWEVFLDLAPHPLAPSLRRILEERFTADERRLLEAALRPAIESGEHRGSDRVAYFQARRPP